MTQMKTVGYYFDKKQQPEQPMTTTQSPAAPLPTLAEGERYIGGIISADGTTTHIILLPGSTKTTWKKAMNWATKAGGDLPTRAEQAILFATAKDGFEPYWYWSNQEDESGWAWCQHFDNGYQDLYHKLNELRARAVRRLVIQSFSN